MDPIVRPITMCRTMGAKDWTPKNRQNSANTVPLIVVVLKMTLGGSRLGSARASGTSVFIRSATHRTQSNPIPLACHARSRGARHCVRLDNHDARSRALASLRLACGLPCVFEARSILARSASPPELPEADKQREGTHQGSKTTIEAR